MTRRHLATAVALVVALGIGLVLGAVVFDQDEDADEVTARSTAGAGEAEAGASDDRPIATLPPPPTVTTDGLEGAALELARAIEEASALEYHAVYRSNAPPKRPGDPSATMTVEVWRRLPLARRDTTIDGPRQLRTQEYRLFDRFVGCIDASAGSDFVCLDEKGKVDPADVLLGAVKPSEGRVIAGRETVLNMPARCYTIVPAGAPQKQVCFDSDGIPLMIDTGEGRLQRASVERTVGNAAFVPPKR